jgi:sugar phosphate isomerase/epimerase
MKISLGINTGFAVNRYPEADEWCRVIAEAGVSNVQLTADIIDVSLPENILISETQKIKKACEKYDLKITSCFTGAFTRVNHLAHPNIEVRKHWVNWFKRFSLLARELDCDTFGSHFGIFSMADDRDVEKRKIRRSQNIAHWHEIADFAKTIGIKTIVWEPMSISREQGETISECFQLQTDVNMNAPLPFKLCLDVDHGDLSSTNPIDTDPYSWLEKFARQSPIIHLKQSSENKGGHWPFTPEYNQIGRIKPDLVLEALRKGGCESTEFILELSFKEREPFDSIVQESLRTSVNYWASVQK